MKKVGLALSGGGARGAYQIGVWKAFKEHGIDNEIDAYAGASVGSLNALLFAMDDYELAYDTWMNLEDRELFEASPKQLFKRLREEKFDFVNQGVYNTEKLKQLMDDTINYSLIQGKEVYLSTTLLGSDDGSFFDLIKMNFKHYIKHENRIEYTNITNLGEDKVKKIALASCAIPVAFSPITIGANSYYDGGILDNIPTEPLEEAGCDLIIVIDLFRFSTSRFKLRKLDEKVITIHPHRSLRGILDFKDKYTKRRFELGYKDGLDAAEEIIERIKEIKQLRS